MTEKTTPGNDRAAEAVPGRAVGSPGPAPQVSADALLGPEADAVFSALADHTRRRLLVELAARPDDAGAVAARIGVSRQAAAKQLRILEAAGIVRVHSEARRRVHSVTPDRLREVSELLGVVAAGWDRRLARIKEQSERRAQELDTP